MALIPQEFPPYEHRPYPKWIHYDDGRESVLVQDKAEHDELLASEKPAKVEFTEEEKAAVEAERQALMDEAKAKGLKPHPKSGVEKLKALLAGAE